MTIRYPGVRTQVLSAVESLADREYQERVWIRGELPHPGYYDELDLSVHTLFDDAAVLPDPASAVGAVLHAHEVGPLHELGAVFGPLIDDLGDQPDAVYLADPRWDDVVRAAVKAYEVMRAHA
ncbi:SCO4402 family protein [Saccharothrix stipae]